MSCSLPLGILCGFQPPTLCHLDSHASFLATWQNGRRKREDALIFKRDMAFIKARKPEPMRTMISRSHIAAGEDIGSAQSPHQIREAPISIHKAIGGPQIDTPTKQAIKCWANLLLNGNLLKQKNRRAIGGRVFLWYAIRSAMIES